MRRQGPAWGWGWGLGSRWGPEWQWQWQVGLGPHGSGPHVPRKAARSAGPSASPAGGPSRLGGQGPGPPRPLLAGGSAGHSLPTCAGRYGQHGEQGAWGPAGAGVDGASGDVLGAGAATATGARVVRYRGGCHRPGGVGAGRRHRTGPCAEGMGGHKPMGSAGFADCCPGPAASSAWSPGAGTCPRAVVASAPWAAGEKLLPLSSHRCSIHSARSFHQRSLLRRSRSPHHQAQCPGAPLHRLSSHLRAQTGGQAAQYPGQLATPGLKILL